VSAGHRLFRAGNTVVHRLPAQVKIVAALAFVLAVVATPHDAYAAFVVHAALVMLALRLARVPALVAVRHLVIELPFVVFAALLPFVAAGPHVDVLGMDLSVPGLEAAWNLFVKATLGVATSLVLAATTSPQSLLQGLVRLRVPAPMVSILAFMVRYADVVGGEVARMRIARKSRAFSARGIRARSPSQGRPPCPERRVRPCIAAQEPVVPSASSRRMSRCPLWRLVSSIRCMSTHRSGGLRPSLSASAAGSSSACASTSSRMRADWASYSSRSCASGICGANVNSPSGSSSVHGPRSGPPRNRLSSQ
jgi:cobalt/nickel transport system permease protein